MHVFDSYVKNARGVYFVIAVEWTQNVTFIVGQNIITTDLNVL